MICCSFIFTPGDYDDDFYELDKKIDKYAVGLAGFDRVEKWQSADGVTLNVMYFFRDHESVALLAGYSEHQTAKRRFDEWYQGYRVDIFELKSSYGKMMDKLNTGTAN